MPDISMCCNRTCPKRGECYRYLAVPCEFRQSYMSMSPDPVTGECDYFSGVWEGSRVRTVEEVDARQKDYFEENRC
jgi:hypothetical protein